MVISYFQKEQAKSQNGLLVEKRLVYFALGLLVKLSLFCPQALPPQQSLSNRLGQSWSPFKSSKRRLCMLISLGKSRDIFLKPSEMHIM